MSQACSWKSGTSSWNIHTYISWDKDHCGSIVQAAHDGTSLWNIHTCALAIINLGCIC